MENGVRRFITEEHAYAMGEKSSAMVGYIQNMELDSILLEVNAAMSGFPEKMKWIENNKNNYQEGGGVTQLSHILERPFPISPFLLHHFWVDLRVGSDD